jgi:L-asparaginase/Glu-tRNA(Gln) amidotransferase subunit D
MVTMDTVDEDIFHMQERKTQMNAAILENGGTLSTAAEKKRESEEIKSMLQNQLNRYLSDRNKQIINLEP